MSDEDAAQAPSPLPPASQHRFACLGVEPDDQNPDWDRVELGEIDVAGIPASHVVVTSAPRGRFRAGTTYGVVLVDLSRMAMAPLPTERCAASGGVHNYTMHVIHDGWHDLACTFCGNAKRLVAGAIDGPRN